MLTSSAANVATFGFIDHAEPQTLQRTFAACGQQLSHEFLTRFGGEVDQRAGQMCVGDLQQRRRKILSTRASGVMRSVLSI